jgi:predicted ATPase with chaperone activity
MTPTAIEHPPELAAPRSVAEAGISVDLIVQLAVKALHFSGELTGHALAARLGLPFAVVEPAIDRLKAQRLCEIVGGTSLGPPSYNYRVTQLGREHAGTYLDRNMYSGVAPVPIAQYNKYMLRFRAQGPLRASRAQVKRAYAHLVLSDRVIDQVGPAINAGHSLFVYGPPGNGKTVIAQGIRNLMPGDQWIPHALEVDGSIIQVFDPVNHELLPPPDPPPGLESPGDHDRRWIACRRPAIMVGGELTLDQLELTYNPTAGFYRAPVQLLANGGVLVIDDFGRQQCSPQALLNRWITPLESRVDFLTLQSGQKVEIPFMVLPVFATNIKPRELVDEAFLRRIQYKVFAESPTRADFVQIFQNYCRQVDLDYDPALADFLIDGPFVVKKVTMRGCHPRDLINQALALAEYREEPRRLTSELLAAACDSYFADEDEGVSRLL